MRSRDDTIPCGIELDWENPHDIARVLDWLEEKSPTGGPLAGRIDLAHVAHLGYSAGARATVMMAGVSRNYVCGQPLQRDQGSVVPCDESDLVDLRDDRIDVALAFSPQAPGWSGFMTESFAGARIPLFTATGANDGVANAPVSATTQMSP